MYILHYLKKAYKKKNNTKCVIFLKLKFVGYKFYFLLLRQSSVDNLECRVYFIGVIPLPVPKYRQLTILI